MLDFIHFHSLNHSLAHSLVYSFTHFLNQSLIHSHTLIRSLIHSHARSLNHSSLPPSVSHSLPPPSLTHSIPSLSPFFPHSIPFLLPHSHTPSLTHSLSPSLPHSLTPHLLAQLVVTSHISKETSTSTILENNISWKYNETFLSGIQKT